MIIQNVIIVDDHPLMRKGLAQLVNALPGFKVCGEADSLTSLDHNLCNIPADCLVLDMFLHGLCMLERIPYILKTNPTLKILVISGYDDELYAFHALQAGAHGFISKSAVENEFAHAMQAIQKGEHYLPVDMDVPLVMRLLSKHTAKGRTFQDKLFTLTVKESEVFRLLGSWKNTTEIAALLKISPKTVEIHRIHIKEKLGCTSLPELMHYAVSWVAEKGPYP